jgi:hypothetical protein
MNASDDPRPPETLPRSFERILLGVAMALAIVFSVGTLGEVYRAFKLRPRVDFTMYHAAARTALAQGDLYHFHETTGDLPYPYPPLLASLLAPVGKLSLGTAYYGWTIFLILALGGLVYLSGRIAEALGARRPWLIAGLTALLCPFLLDSNLYWGQVNIPVMVITAGGVLLGLRGRTTWAGALIGLAAALKLLPVALVLWFLVRRDWKAVAAAVGTALGCLIVVPSLVGGPAWMLEMNRGWLDLFFAALTKGGEGLQSNGGYLAHSKNGSIAAICDRMFGGSGQAHNLTRLPQETINGIALVLRLTVVFVSVAAVARVYRPRRADVEPYLWPLAAALLLIMGWMVNLLLWDHHTIGIVMILTVVATACLDDRLPEGVRNPLWFGLTAAIAGLACGFFPGARKLGLPTLTLAVLWGSLAWVLVTSPAPVPPPAPEPERQLTLPFD